MTIYPDGTPMSEADASLFERGDELTSALMEFVGAYTDKGNIDVRVLAIALGNVLGCYVYGITDKETKIRLAQHFCRTFFECAGLPLKVEAVS